MESYKDTDKIFAVYDGVKHSDVFGKWERKAGGEHVNIDQGMVVAYGEHGKKVRCPIFGDIVPYKSVTVVCKPEQEDAVMQHLADANASIEPSQYKELPDGRIAMRSDYNAW